MRILALVFGLAAVLSQDALAQLPPLARGVRLKVTMTEMHGTGSWPVGTVRTLSLRVRRCKSLSYGDFCAGPFRVCKGARCRRASVRQHWYVDPRAREYIVLQSGALVEFECILRFASPGAADGAYECRNSDVSYLNEPAGTFTVSSWG